MLQSNEFAPKAIDLAAEELNAIAKHDGAGVPFTTHILLYFPCIILKFVHFNPNRPMLTLTVLSRHLCFTYDESTLVYFLLVSHVNNQH